MENITKLETFLKSLIGNGKQFKNVNEMARALNLQQTQASKLYNYFNGSDVQYKAVFSWMDALGVQIVLPNETVANVETEHLKIELQIEREKVALLKELMFNTRSDSQIDLKKAN